MLSGHYLPPNLLLQNSSEKNEASFEKQLYKFAIAANMIATKVDHPYTYMKK